MDDLSDASLFCKLQPSIYTQPDLNPQVGATSKQRPIERVELGALDEPNGLLEIQRSRTVASADHF